MNLRENMVYFSYRAEAVRKPDAAASAADNPTADL